MYDYVMYWPIWGALGGKGSMFQSFVIFHSYRSSFCPLNLALCVLDIS
jgi:hypothetical protein